MKKFGLILAGCLAFVGFGNAHADDIGDAVRAAVRRDTGNTVVSSRQKTDSLSPETTSRKSSNTVVRNSSASARSANVISRSAEQTTQNSTNVIARTTVAPRSATNTAQKTTRSARTPISRFDTRTTATRTATRAATKVATREDILMRNYSKCREVFNDCMDEFCANKDAQLKRCACSARVNDFNKIKQQLAEFDEKMLDFNQRLLMVGMDEKDVAAINIATEGEKAFYDTTDVSESKRTLDAIAKKLNLNFDDDGFSSRIGTALSWSLDMDNAFDSIDSLGGMSTTAKTGTALYAAALPVCREMAAEVCSDDDLSLAESGYQVLIDQACDTVEKTYKTAAQQARTKVLESSALLDISRLNVYQKNNADDILTCKKKMLNMLTNSTVCGADMGKCLDVTGQYIDPSTGEAFLSSNLADLGSLITRPSGNQTWTNAPGNSVFVTFINSKKKFLEPAMENCQDIADTVWNAFIEDALSQIKIAQIRKLEDVRQSCTTLTAQCLSDAFESITNFDARALSTFGVTADMTANAMCENVLSSCTTLLDTTDVISATDREWYLGMTGIQNDLTYATIKQTCNQVGRACIIQVCTSTSGNFGLCENIDTSINRKSIINRTACWNEVLDCVNSAGEDTIAAIFEQNNLAGTDDSKYPLYSQIYSSSYYGSGMDNPKISNDDANRLNCIATDGTDDNTGVNNCIYDICYDQCGNAAYADTNDCRVCRLAESIWGNCEAAPSTQLASNQHNQIKSNADTLLNWFAQNTNTENELDNCRDTTCGPGFTAFYDSENNTVMCVDENDVDSIGAFCPFKINIVDGYTNCCNTNKKDDSGNCCGSDFLSADDICKPNNATLVATFSIADGNTYYPAGNYSMYCTGTVGNNTGDNSVTCNGDYIIIKTNGQNRYMGPLYDDNTPSTKHYETFMTQTNGVTTTHSHVYSDGAWKWDPVIPAETGITTPLQWMVSSGNN